VTAPDHCWNAAFADIAFQFYIVNVGESLGTQQFLRNVLRRNTGYRALTNQSVV